MCSSSSAVLFLAALISAASAEERSAVKFTILSDRVRVEIVSSFIWAMKKKARLSELYRDYAAGK
jgi:hypothetical protein